MYIHPDDTHIYKHTLARLFGDPALHGLPIVLSGDLNARHTYWHDTTNSARGIELEDLMSQLDLDHHNTGSFTCYHAGGRSVIDLTVTNTLARNSVTNWRVVDRITNTDHALIGFDVSLGPHDYHTNKFSLLAGLLRTRQLIGLGLWPVLTLLWLNTHTPLSRTRTPPRR